MRRQREKRSNVTGGPKYQLPAVEHSPPTAKAQESASSTEAVGNGGGMEPGMPRRCPIDGYETGFPSKSNHSIANSHPRCPVASYHMLHLPAQTAGGSTKIPSYSEARRLLNFGVLCDPGVRPSQAQPNNTVASKEMVLRVVSRCKKAPNPKMQTPTCRIGQNTQKNERKSDGKGATVNGWSGKFGKRRQKGKLPGACISCQIFACWKEYMVCSESI
ncbi:hypothetical protein DFH09DRAFT_1077574 [Mycena vulgaris]|nr:hypothetical protein DFH09DRAFT_1077574 [Mycena vulgaris]